MNDLPTDNNNSEYDIDINQKIIKFTEQETWHDYYLATIALANNLVTKEQIETALIIQKNAKKLGQKIILEKIFLEKKWISSGEISALQNATKRRLGKKFGTIAIEKGIVTEAQINSVLLIQAQDYKINNTCRRIGEILVDQGILTHEQCFQVWKEQLELEIALSVAKKKEEKRQKDIEANSLEDVLDTVPENDGLMEVKDHENSSDITDEDLAFIIKDSEDSQDLSANNLSLDYREYSELDSEAELSTSDIKDVIKIQIPENKEKAEILVSENVNIEDALDYIKELLTDNGITYGIADDESIIKFLGKQNNKTRSFIIAQGQPPKEGRDTVIKYHFDTSYLSAGKISDDGKIDYRDRGEIPHVKEGGLIAEKILHKKGEKGVDICGRTIMPKEVKILNLTRESNVIISENRLKAHSEIEGRPHLTMSGSLAVYDEIQINGDVDFKTGNIEYKGDVIVQGTVQNEFSVKCNNLTALAVNNATVDAGGDVVIANGITDSRINAKGSITSKYIKNSNIKAFGNVVVEKEVYDCKVRTSSEFISEQGDIISSLVTARQGITSRNIGTDISSPCKLVVGLDDHVRKIIQKFETRAAEDVKVIATLQAEHDDIIKNIAIIATKMDDLKLKQEKKIDKKLSLQEKTKTQRTSSSDLANLNKQISAIDSNISGLEDKSKDFADQLEDLKKSLAATLKVMDDLIQTIEDLNEEKTAIEDWAETVERCAIIKVSGALHSGTKIKGLGLSKALKDTKQNVTVEEKEISEAEFVMNISINNT